MKKVLSWLLLCAMLLALPLTVFAEDGGGGTAIPTTKMGFRNGNRFYMYDPSNFNSSTGDTILKFDGTYFTLNRDFKNPVSGEAVTSGVLQYREAMSGDYALTYDVRLNEELKDRFYTMFYWQDYTENGRSFQTSTRGVGFALQTDINSDGTLSFTINKWEAAEGNGTRTTDVADGSAPATSSFLQGAQAGQVVSFRLEWKDQVLTVSASKADDAAATTGDVIFDLSGEAAYLEAVKEPAGFAIWMSPVAAEATESSGFGNFALTDLTVADSAATPIAASGTAFLNGGRFYMYDPVSFDGGSGDALFQCDGTYFTLNRDFKNPLTGEALTSAVLQSRQVMRGDYRLTFEVALNEELKDRFYTMFYWQDYTGNGRSMQTSGRGVGFTLMTQIADGNLSFSVLKWEANQGAGSSTTVAEGSAPASSTFLQDAAAGEKLSFSLEWKDQVLTVSASKADDAAATTGDVIFDLSGETAYLEAVQDPAGFAIWMVPVEGGATASSGFGKFSLEALSAEQLPADCWNYSVLDPNTFATKESGDNFVRGEDGWFTRSSGVATDVAAVTYSKSVTYNYELTFHLKLNAENKGRFGIWNIWNGKFGGTPYGYMLVISTATDGTLEYRLARYSPSYGMANDLATDETKGNVSGSTILQGQPANAELLVKVVVNGQTLTVDTCLTSDPSRAVGTVVYDLSGDSESLIHRMTDRTLGFALVDMGPSIDGGAGASTSLGNVTYRILPGSAPDPDEETDPNDYETILADTNYAYSGDIACNEDNFKIYTRDAAPFELFQTNEDGWFYRTNENGDTTTNQSAENAYAHAQYKGVMDEGDYRLTFSILCNEDNRCRVAVMTRWEDKDDQSSLLMTSQIGFRFYIRVEDGMLYVRCYQSTGGYLPPLNATADNADSDMLQGLTETNAQLDVTMVMKGDLVVMEVSLASDPTKTTGPVAFDLSENSTLYSQIDRTQGFLITDAACEYKIEPAAIGNIKLWASAAPVLSEDGSGDLGDPDENLPPVTTKEPDDETSAPSTEEDPADTTAPSSDDEKGCKSSVAASSAVLAVLALGVAAIAIRKRKLTE